jgi:putative transposase
MVDWESMELPVSTQAELLSLNRTGLYYQPVPPSAHEVACKHRIDEIYTAHCYYGYRRIAAQLQREGQPINQKTVARYMQEMGLAAVYPGPNLSKRAHQAAIYPYLLANVKATTPNHIWGIDLTYIRLRGSWMYLVAILDWYSRYVVSWELDQTMQMAFVIEAVQRALSQARPQIWNSDQGSQFTSPQYTQLLLSHDVRISMDGKGRALDNIFTERVRRCARILLVGAVQLH